MLNPREIIARCHTAFAAREPHGPAALALSKAMR